MDMSNTPAPAMPVLLRYELQKATRRLTFDIHWQHPELTWMGDDDGDYFKFTASNGYEVISRSRMDIQTERLWLLGAKHAEEARSGSMVFSTNEKRDAAYAQFVLALDEWAAANGGTAVMGGVDAPAPVKAALNAPTADLLTHRPVLEHSSIRKEPRRLVFEVMWNTPDQDDVCDHLLCILSASEIGYSKLNIMAMEETGAGEKKVDRMRVGVLTFDCDRKRDAGYRNLTKAMSEWMNATLKPGVVDAAA